MRKGKCARETMRLRVYVYVLAWDVGYNSAWF